MSHQSTWRAFALAALLATTTTPVLAAPPETADVDRLFEVMAMDSMFADVMKQASDAQTNMVTSAFSGSVSETERKHFNRVMERTNAMVRERASWEALAPIFRKVYLDVFTKSEVQAMTAFYESPEGASTLRKSPQAMAQAMEQMQPLMLQLMQDIQNVVEEEAAKQGK